MTIKEYYDNYKKNKKYPHALLDGYDNTVNKFYKNCIEKHMLPKDNVLEWHKMFLEYIERDDAVFWVRYYEGGSKNSGRWNNRRACKTDFNNLSYVFVSNYDVHEIFNMVRLIDSPKVEEFLALMKDHEFPLHYCKGKSCEESDISSYRNIGTTKGGILTAKNLYLAHIIGVKSTPYVNCSNEKIYFNVEDLYPRGSLSDWNDKDAAGEIVRKINKDFTPDERKLITAHFLRFVDPLNYYVVPGKNYQKNQFDKQIGEVDCMNDYMSAKFEEVYASNGWNIMKDFRKLVLAPVSIPKEDGNTIINIEYGPKIKSTSTNKAIKNQPSNSQNNMIPSKKTAIDLTKIAVPNYLESFKVGQIVKEVLVPIFESGQISKKDVDLWKTDITTKSSFPIRYPLLSIIRTDAKGNYRYYAKKLSLYGETLYMCNDWYSTDRPAVIDWILDWLANGGRL